MRWGVLIFRWRAKELVILEPIEVRQPDLLAMPCILCQSPLSKPRERLLSSVGHHGVVDTMAIDETMERADDAVI